MIGLIGLGRVRRLLVLVGLMAGLSVVGLLVGAASAVAAPPAFTQVAGSPFATGRNPVSVAFSPSGGLLATANQHDNTVSVFSVGSGGGADRGRGLPVRDRQLPGVGGVQPERGVARDRQHGR